MEGSPDRGMIALDELTKDALIKQLRKHGLPVSGLKSDLIRRLEEHQRRGGSGYPSPSSDPRTRPRDSPTRSRVLVYDDDETALTEGMRDMRVVGWVCCGCKRTNSMKQEVCMHDRTFGSRTRFRTDGDGSGSKTFLGIPYGSAKGEAGVSFSHEKTQTERCNHERCPRCKIEE